MRSMTEPILAIVFANHFAACAMLPALPWQKLWMATLEDTARALHRSQVSLPERRPLRSMAQEQHRPRRRRSRYREERRNPERDLDAEPLQKPHRPPPSSRPNVRNSFINRPLAFPAPRPR